jgi:hypothetical protein
MNDPDLTPFGTLTPAALRRQNERRAQQHRDALRVHEAGHAMVAHLFGYRGISVELEASGGRALYTEPRGERDTPEGRLRLLCLALAGIEAEVLVWGAPVLVGGYRGDERKAARWLAHWPDHERQAVRERATARACQLLREWWPDVEWIAESGKVGALLAPRGGAV